MDKKTKCDNAVSLLHFVRGFAKLWQKPQVDEKDHKITDGTTSLSIKAVEEKSESSIGELGEVGQAFIITLSGDYAAIEPLREPIAAFLKDIHFELVYVLRDQVSEDIACKLYPHLYRIENLLGGFTADDLKTGENLAKEITDILCAAARKTFEPLSVWGFWL